MVLSESSIVLPPDANGDGAGYPFFITAKRYSLKEVERLDEDYACLTILALHSTSFHKEAWEPTLDALFNTMATNGAGKVLVREVWAVDCPNHGQSGALNAKLLKGDRSCEFLIISCSVSTVALIS
jgi:hypothetical protein